MRTKAHPRCARINSADKARLRFLFLAKHARAVSGADEVDGNHAVYHQELRETLRAIGLNFNTADSFPAIFEKPEADFVITLLNRGGFQNSEMLAPLLLTRHGIPFLGASPIIRGLADDKHLSKVAARARGVPTAEWQIYRRGAGAVLPPSFRSERMVVKPNASSASWGVVCAEDWDQARAEIAALMAEGHDVLVEPWTPLLDVAAPVIGGADGEAWLLPPMMYLPADPHRQRSYEEKRGLIDAGDDPLVLVEDPHLSAEIRRHTIALMTELWPFDYGRFEYRYDPATGSLLFMEVNLSCNLWSKKTIARSAATLGLAHEDLVETILAHSLARQSVIGARQIGVAA